MISIEVKTGAHRQMVNVTAQVRQAVAAAEVDRGLCHVSVPHTTAAVVVNESADPDVAQDLLAAYETMIPKIPFAHAEGNSDAHFLSTVVGPSVTLPVEGGQLRLGRWQGLFFVELDGPRTRQLWVTVV